MNKTLTLDSTIFISIRYLSFIIAAIVSVFLNVFFFQSLDTGGFWWILFLVSILVELAKVSTLLTRNVFSSIYLKTIKKAINYQKNKFLVFYLSLALLSILTGLGFTIVVTSKSATVQEMGVEILQTKIAEIKDLEIRRINYISAKDGTLSTYPPYIDANNNFIKAQGEQEAADLSYRNALAIRNRFPNDPESETWSQRQQAQREVNAQEQLLAAANSALRNARDRRTLIVNEYNEVQQNADNRIADLDAEFLIMSRDLELTSSTARLAVIELEQQLAELNRKIIEAKGMGYMFDIFAQFLHVSPESIKFWILLFVAFLIELTIYQCSPDIRVNRRVLYFFRNFIPLDININELLNKFDEELMRFEDRVEKPIQQVKTIEEDDEKFTIGEPDILPQKSRRKKKKIEVETTQVESAVSDSNKESFVRSMTSKEKEIWEKNITDSNTVLLNNENSSTEIETIDIPVEKKMVFQFNKPEPLEFDSMPRLNLNPIKNETIDETIHLPSTVIEDKEEKVEKPEQINNTKNLPFIESNKEIKEENSVSEITEKTSSEELIHYRFGKTTPSIMKKLIDFINLCIVEEGPFNMQPDFAATQLKLGNRAKQVFIDRLLAIRLGSKSLITKNKFGEFYSNYSSKQIIDYVSGIIND